MCRSSSFFAMAEGEQSHMQQAAQPSSRHASEWLRVCCGVGFERDTSIFAVQSHTVSPIEEPVRSLTIPSRLCATIVCFRHACRRVRHASYSFQEVTSNLKTWTCIFYRCNTKKRQRVAVHRTLPGTIIPLLSACPRLCIDSLRAHWLPSDISWPFRQKTPSVPAAVSPTACAGCLRRRHRRRGTGPTFSSPRAGAGA